MKYFKVCIPVLQVLRINDVEPGMVLRRSVFVSGGRVLAEKGVEVTEDLLEKFRNFRVRKVAIREEQVHWISEADAEKLPSEAEIIEREEFSEAADEIVSSIENTNSVSKMRNIARYLSRQSAVSAEGPAREELNRIIERSYELEDKIEQLMEELETVEDPEVRDKIMTTLENTVAEIEENFLELSAPDSLLQSSLEAVNEKEDIRSSITEFVNENPDVVEQETESQASKLQVETVEDQYKDFVRDCNQGHVISAVNKLKKFAESSVSVEEIEEIKAEINREISQENSLKKELTTETSDFTVRSDLLEILEGRQETTRKELEAKPLSEDFVSKTLSFLETREENRKNLWDAANEVTDDSLQQELAQENFVQTTACTDVRPDFLGEAAETSKENEIPECEFEDLLSDLQGQDLKRGSEKLRRLAQKSGKTDSALAAQIKVAGETAAKIDREAEQVADRIREEVSDSTKQQELVAGLKGKRELSEDELQQVPISKSLEADLQEIKERRSNQQKRLWEAADELSGGAAGERRKQMSQQASAPADNKNLKVSESEAATEEAENQRRSILPEADQDLFEVLEGGDEYDISDLTGLDLQTVRTGQHVLETPAADERQVQSWLQEASRVVKTIFYGRDFSESELNNLVAQTRTLLENTTHPLKLLASPPAEEKYLFTHSINTFALSIFLGSHQNYSEGELLDLAGASLTQDLGMLEIPRALWLTEGEPTNRGWGEIHKHPVISREIVNESLNNDRVLIDLVNQHHEKVDGSGYPRGLEVEEQHQLSPLLTVADAYTALLEERPHRGAYTPDKALLVLLKNKSEFSREISKLLLNEVGFYPDGSVVLLSDGSLAQVRDQGEGNPISPRVVVVTDAERNRLDSPRQVNLGAESDLEVKKLVKY